MSAVLWNLISTPMLFFVPRELERNPVVATALIAFPIVGATLLVWAITATLRWRRFGQTWLETTPAVPGGACIGTVHVRLDRPGAASASSSGNRLVVIVKLTCVQRVISGRGKGLTVDESILWRQEEHVGQERILFTPAGAAIPVHIPLPADALPTTTTSKGSAGVFWSLTVEASLPGIDLSEDFDVPVGAPGVSPNQRV